MSDIADCYIYNDSSIYMEQRKHSTVVIGIMNTLGKPLQVEANLKEAGYESIIQYAALADAFPEEFEFLYLESADKYKTRAAHVQHARDILIKSGCDDRSIVVFDALDKFRSTKNYIDLPSIDKKDEQYFPRDIKGWATSSISFVDCGAYIGDTFDLLSQYAKESKCDIDFYTGIEPDASNCRELENHIQNLQLTENKYQVINCAITAKRKEVKFLGTGSTASKVVDADDSMVGAEIIQGRNIDSISFPVRPTHIKMDIEGSEYEALIGAKTTITQEKPNLAICIYHKPEDFYSIIELLDSWGMGGSVYAEETEMTYCELSVIFSYHHILVYGIGNQWRECYKLLKPQITAIFDGNSKKWGTEDKVSSLVVNSPDILAKYWDDDTCVVIGCIKNQYEIATMLSEKYSIAKERIFMYTSQWYEENVYQNSEIKVHIGDVERLAPKFADANSSKYYLHSFYARASRSPYFLEPNPNMKVTGEYSDALTIQKGERIIDCGAYTGDTAQYYLSKTGGDCKVYACEPFVHSYSEMKDRIITLSATDKIIPYNVAISDCVRTDEIRYSTDQFDMSMTIDGHLGELVQKVKVETIDHLFENEKISYIKMDIEGEECNALMGGAEINCKTETKANDFRVS